MGCVSSNLLSNEDEFTQLGSSALSHHIVSLTSTTYGLLNLDPPTPQPPPPTTTTPPLTPPQRFTLGSIWSEPRPLRSDSNINNNYPPDINVINSWELMSGLDTTDSFRFSPFLKKDPLWLPDKENSNPNRSLDKFERLCPPSGENRVVVYTTTLRGIRKTFEACNAVRSAMKGFGVWVCERDVSMDRGFREELRELMKGKVREELVPPRVFVRGRYLGGAEEVMKIVEEGWMGELLEGLPMKKAGDFCEGCGDVRFLPCFSCNGSCKLAMIVKEDLGQKEGTRCAVVRCPDCNENGLVLCPICS